MAETKCTGNCMACTIFQRQYCASQLAYSNMRMLELMQQSISTMQEKIDALQNNEATLFYPTNTALSEQTTDKDKAQNGDGA